MQEHDNLTISHVRAKQCPMRAKKLQGKGFTYNQMYTWLGYMAINIEKKGISKVKGEQLLALKVKHMGFYEPNEQD